MVFFYLCVFKMKSNNFLVGSFLIGIGLVIGFGNDVFELKNLMVLHGFKNPTFGGSVDSKTTIFWLQIFWELFAY